MTSGLSPKLSTEWNLSQIIISQQIPSTRQETGSKHVRWLWEVAKEKNNSKFGIFHVWFSTWKPFYLSDSPEKVNKSDIKPHSVSSLWCYNLQKPFKVMCVIVVWFKRIHNLLKPMKNCMNSATFGITPSTWLETRFFNSNTTWNKPQRTFYSFSVLWRDSKLFSSRFQKIWKKFCHLFFFGKYSKMLFLTSPLWSLKSLCQSNESVLRRLEAHPGDRHWYNCYRCYVLSDSFIEVAC